MIWTLLLAGVVAAAGPEVEVRALDGRAVVGAISGVDAKAITLETAKGPVATPLDQVVRLAPSSPGKTAGAGAVCVSLIDGSVILADQCTVSKGRVTLVRGKEKIDVPSQDVRCVRFQPTDARIDPQWDRLLTEADKADGDLLVTRKDDALDYHQGLIGDVTDERVAFTLDGKPLPVKRTKVFGLIYRHPAGRSLAEAIGRLTDASGSRWAVAAVTFDKQADAGQGSLRVTTPSGTSVTLPIGRLVELDFSQGKIIHLGDLKPESVRFWPYFGNPRDLPRQAEFFRPRSDRGLGVEPLRLGGKEYAKGLALHSRSQVEYALPGAFSRFKATVGIDDRVRPGGNVRLELRGDERVLLDRVFKGTDAPEPIEVDVSGVRRLTILVDYAEQLDVGDHLDLCEARIVK